MNFEQLDNLWKETDASIELKTKVNRQLVVEVAIREVRSHLSELKWGAIFELVVGFIWSCFLIGFMIDHFSEIHFLLPALLLLIISFLSMALVGYRLWLFYFVKPQYPILSTQKRLEKMRFLELVEIKSLLVVIPLFSAPFLIVAAKALINVDLFEYGNWWLWHSAGSIIIAGILVFFLYKFRSTRLKESISFINELERFGHNSDSAD